MKAGQRLSMYWIALARSCPRDSFADLLAHIGLESVDQRPASIAPAGPRRRSSGALAVDRRARSRTARRCGARPRSRSARAGSPSCPQPCAARSPRCRPWRRTGAGHATQHAASRIGPGLRSAQIELVVAVIGVGLQDAGVAGQMRLRMLAAPIARVIEHRRRRPGAAERPVVADVDPEPPGVGLALGQHRHRRASRPRGFHPRPLPEPGVRLSPHPAPIRPARRLRQVASARTTVGFRARSSRGKSRA